MQLFEGNLKRLQMVTTLQNNATLSDTKTQHIVTKNRPKTLAIVEYAIIYDHIANLSTGCLCMMTKKGKRGDNHAKKHHNHIDLFAKFG